MDRIHIIETPWKHIYLEKFMNEVEFNQFREQAINKKGYAKAWTGSKGRFAVDLSYFDESIQNLLTGHEWTERLMN
ncbi:hypothetical protein TetV_641 [Tetraselmis virus 1]|uniref:Uncharacterized protein n=1 Tax=Tetraselmis virus 1 TaxID=2060617 RepID=A0A2P0VP90_9VIRU|nr:hypothetical protein QJ968_gp413 [Tetraselmis virus 1]AUF82723.1 hypothetical protein TetV_641 [Tetraselmis virus 1]